MTLRWHLPDVLDRARAAFLGAALGDALGATVEFMTPGEIRAAHGVHREITGGGWLRLRAGAVTDDTEMALCLGRAIAAEGRLEPRAAADGWVAWLRGGPVDAGNTVRRGLRRYLLDGSLAGPPSEGDAGNGAAMRMVPVALATLADRARLEADALAQARITHHHPLSDAAAIHVGELVQLACLGLSLRRLRRASEALAERFPAFAPEPYHGLATGYVPDTLRTVLHFLHRTGGFEECLVAVVNQGGDADTTGAIAAMLAGAAYGTAAIPRKWLRRLDRKVATEIRAQVPRLLAIGRPQAMSANDRK